MHFYDCNIIIIISNVDYEYMNMNISSRMHAIINISSSLFSFSLASVRVCLFAISLSRDCLMDFRCFYQLSIDGYVRIACNVYVIIYICILVYPRMCNNNNEICLRFSCEKKCKMHMSSLG